MAIKPTNGRLINYMSSGPRVALGHSFLLIGRSRDHRQ